MARRYNQHCALAHALDLTGDRWTLLIVRDLLAGPRRYSDLAEGLVTVPTNVLADRLKEMETSGLVRRERLAPPADSVVVYRLTELGEGLAASLVELARWGMQTVPPTRENRSFRSHWLVLALQARFEPEAALGVEESYEFRLDGDEVVRFDVSDGAGTARMGPASDPAVVIATDADTFVELSGGAITPAEAIERGASIDADPAALARMRTILPSRAPTPQEAIPTV
jgi:DNA-binding HxlR family transcriptional regulator